MKLGFLSYNLLTGRAAHVAVTVVNMKLLFWDVR